MQAQWPFVLERFAALTGQPFLAVQLEDGDALPPDLLLDRLLATLHQLPCPSLAMVSKPGPALSRLLEAFDVVVTTEDSLREIAATVREQPIASLALVQLLRQNQHQDVHHGLTTESLAYSTLQGGPEFNRWLSMRASRKPVHTPRGPAVITMRRAEQLDVVLNRPEKHNAFSVEIRDGLVEALQIALCDPSIREIVIRGAGESFCSGGDLDEFGSLPDPATAHAIRSTRNVARLLAGCAQRTRFELHGACIGAGIELPAFAAHVSAHTGTFFQLPEVRLGLVPGAGGSVSLPRRIGRQRTAFLALSGQRIDVTTAHAWGLIDEVVV